MLSYFLGVVKIVLKGFASTKYFFLNCCLYAVITTGILLFFENMYHIAYALGATACLLFIFVIYYDWRLSKVFKEYYYLFYTLHFAPFAIVIFDKENKIVNYNDIYQMLCENTKISNFDELLVYFKDYSALNKCLVEGMSTIEKEDSFNKDINFGDKIWRISMSSQFSKLGLVKSLFIIDITSDIKTNSMDKILSSILNYVEDGVIVTNRSGNIVFYNISAANILKISLVGKNIKNLPGFANIQANITNKINISDKTNLNVVATYFGEDYVLYRIKLLNILQMDDTLSEAPFGILTINSDLNIVFFNKFWTRYFATNFKLEQCVSPSKSDAFMEYIRHLVKTKNTTPVSFTLVRDNGPFVTIYSQFNKNGHINLFFMEDINSRDLKAQFLHEQRLYSLGEIVGSIAHDFNNIITTVLGNCDVILERNSFPPTNEDYVDLMRIKHSAGRASDLIKQILNISRKQTLQETILNVNDLLSEFVATIGRVLGDKFDLKLVKKKTNISIFMNEVSFEQIAINLLLNARDAMPYGGMVQISSDIVNIDKSVFDGGNFVTRGEYLELAISDSGIGISAENIKKIFDPFFTTKNEKGTGFGLSTVNSLVKQKGGFIRVTSKIGVGTTFFIYIPLYNVSREVKTVNYETIVKPINILFVEDEINILIASTKGLKAKGFEVVSSKNGKEALEIGLQMKTLDILISDVSLPKLGGIELFQELRKKHPNLKVIFTSGYLEDKIGNIAEDKGVLFLQKPYSIKDLYQYIAKCNV